jgi:hypothetical protein
MITVREYMPPESRRIRIVGRIVPCVVRVRAAERSTEYNLYARRPVRIHASEDRGRIVVRSKRTSAQNVGAERQNQERAVPLSNSLEEVTCRVCIGFDRRIHNSEPCHCPAITAKKNFALENAGPYARSPATVEPGR